MLLILLAVFSGMPGSERLFQICSLVVLISIVIHGASPMLLARFSKKVDTEEPPLAPEVPKEARALPVIEPAPEVGRQSVTLEELDQLQETGDEVVILDARTERSRDTSESQAEGSVRLVPENVVAQARQLNLPKEAWLIVYCA